MNLSQLESARTLALGEGRYYPTIIPGVLPIIGAGTNTDIEIQRWGAEFLAETFASPTWPSDLKEASSLTVLPTLKEYVTTVDDPGVLKAAVQAAATIYPLVYRHIVTDPNDSQNWQHMLAIKSSILRRMDSATSSVRVCCVKFIQQVVLVQTPGMVADPRRPEQNDISLALVPRDHPLIPYSTLEAEASGLLDRLLDIIHGDHSNALLVTATLNTLGMLIQRRPIIANKIINSVLSFNPLKLANSPMTPTNKVIMKSLERTTRALLMNAMKRNPENPLNGRIQQYLERMHRIRLDVFDESSRKRPAHSESTDGLDQTKRQRLGAQTPDAPPAIPPLPPGPVSYRQLYTLDPKASTANFDVQIFKDPEQLIMVLVHVLRSIDDTKLGNAMNAIRSRWLALSKETPRIAEASGGAAVDDEEEYEPDFEPEDAEQISNRLDGVPPDEQIPERVTNAPLAPYKLPEAPPLTQQEVQKYGESTMGRAFSMLSSMDDFSVKAKSTPSGFNRLAASNYDRDAWVTILSRLATRASAGLDDPDDGIKSEYHDPIKTTARSLSDKIRDNIYTYILKDWKRRLDVAISWLNEEWYNDRLQVQAARRMAKATLNGNAASMPDPKGNYHKCALRLIDGISPYVEGTDKILLRFFSEMPEINREILQRMKKLAEDPERIDLSVMVLQYLHMFRPPVRDICIDVLEDMWQTNERAKPSAKKLLIKWRPAVVESDDQVKVETELTSRTLAVKAA